MIELLRELIEIPSPTGQEARVCEVVERRLQQRGFRVERQPVSPGRFNLLATTEVPPDVLLCTHLDVVEPHLSFSLEGPVIRGRGACDAKGIAVCMIEAASRLVRSGVRNIGLLFVVGEERDSDGARSAARQAPAVRGVIVGEPTRNRLVRAQKGSLVFRLTVAGKTGHSAYPESGDSAIHRLVMLAAGWLATDWGKDPARGCTTLNLGTIEGGSGANVIAGMARTDGIFRVATSVEEVLRRIRATLDAEMNFEIASSSEPIELSTLEGFDPVVVSFGSDAPYLRPLGKIFMAGPGSIEYAHTDREQIGIEELEEGVSLYVRIASQLAASEGREVLMS